MASEIPFVNSRQDLALLRETHGDVEIVRVSLLAARNLSREDLAGFRLWLDPCVDGLLRKESEQSDALKAVLARGGEYQRLQDEGFVQHPDKGTVGSFVFRMLDACAALEPAIVSVPQLPHVTGTAHNRLNHVLAEAARRWAEQGGFGGRLVLPVILTGKSQYMLKKHRDNVANVAVRGLELSGSAGLWFVDSGLQDQLGQGDFTERFARLADLHREVLGRVPERPEMVVTGPFWCLSLVLWSQGLASHVATGLGGSYQYHLPGLAHIRTPKVRIALEPLRRTAVAGPSLRNWLEESLSRLKEDEGARSSLAGCLRDWELLQSSAAARTQVAGFHRRWCRELEAAEAHKRGLRLYRMLSDSYVLGRRLPEIEGEGPARRPEQVAMQHMLNCL